MTPVRRDIRRPTAQAAGAVDAAGRGWAVFPTIAGQKRPPAHMTDWETRAAADLERVAAWWARHPRDNPAIACGPSGLVVVDLDTPKPTTPPPPSQHAGAGCGLDVFRDLAELAGAEWPDTYTVRTGRGGLHLYFTAPPDAQEATGGQEVAVSWPRGTARPPGGADQHSRGLRAGELRSTSGRLGWLIDTRAGGGYVLAAGSVVNGRRYRLHHDAPVAELPGWLVSSLRARSIPAPAAPARPVRVADRYVQVALDAEVHRAAAAPVGRRHWELNKAAWNLTRHIAEGRLTRPTVEGALQHAGEQAGRAPKEVAATIRSALNAGLRRRNGGTGR